MQVLSSPHVPIAALSPTLTNPDMILPHDSSSEDSAPSTPRRPQRLPSPPTFENGHNRSGSAPDDKPRVKPTMYSPFRNGLLRRHDGSTRLRSSSENRDKRDQSRFSYQPENGDALASSPILPEDYDGAEQKSYAETAMEDYGHVETTDSIYNTPSILEEDENDPYSHAAMTKRAEEILANAKKRLTTMEGNLSRARSTLDKRPSSSMSSFANRNAEPVSLYTIPSKSRLPGTFSPAKHRQPNGQVPDESKPGHSRVFSETSVPSSLATTLPNGQPPGEEESKGVGANGADAASRDRHSEPSRNWFWNGLTRNTSLNYVGRHNNGLQPLNEDGPAPESFEEPAAQHEDIEEEVTVDPSSPKADTFEAHTPPTNGLARARSTTQMHELREQMQDLRGKISTLKQRAREDSLKRRSLQSLRTPSPFTAAEQWYMGAPAAESSQSAPGSGLAEVSGAPPSAEEERPEVGEKALNDSPQDSGHASPVVEQDSHMTNGSTAQRPDTQTEPDLGDEAGTGDLQLKAKSGNGYPSKKKRLVLIDEPSPVKQNHENSSETVYEEPTPGDEEARTAGVDNPEDSLYGDEDYHDTHTSPIVERHEDRPDAFDYEHFMLHSALGSYSGIGMRRSSTRRDRSSSLSSGSSVETTKPRNSMGEKPLEPALVADNMANGGHGRQNSIESVSTVNTFATAFEDKESEASEVSDAVQEEPAPRQKVEFPRNRADRIRPEPRARNSFRNRKHITTAQKGWPNGGTPKTSPVEKPTSAEPLDVLGYLSSLAPKGERAQPEPLTLGEKDKEMVERVVQSLSKLCIHMHTLGPEGSKYEARVFRRKLDAARRILDGEMNGEAF